MTITRMYQTGLEHNDSSEYVSLNGTPVISSSKAKTGTYSLRVAQGSVYFMHTSTGTQAQASMYINHAGLASGAAYAVICAFYSDTTAVAQVRWYADGTLRAFCGATQVATTSVPSLYLENTWVHIGVDIKIDGAAGWFSVYVDGTEEISFTGDTDDGDTSFNRFVVGNSTGDATEKWDDYLYIDDIYWNDTDSEVAAALPDGYRYYLLTPNGDGNYSQFIGSDGNSVNNYEMVDEIPPDDDTTYVSHDTDTERDSYTMSDYTIPVGSSVAAVIPVVKARKESPGSTYGMSLFTRVSATDQDGSKQSLGTSWGWIFERQTTDPAAGAWEQADITSLEVGIRVES